MTIQPAAHERLYKLGYAEPSERELQFDNCYAVEERKGVPLLCLGPRIHPIALIKTLLERMPEPFWVLYILAVSRGEGAAGRYQSANTLLREDLVSFLDRFCNYFESDARHHLWLKSENGPALLVSDTHGLIYCYGPIDEWASDLRKAGWNEVAAGSIRLSDPHSHHYHAIFDDDAKAVLNSMEWRFSPLQDQDR